MDCLSIETRSTTRTARSRHRRTESVGSRASAAIRAVRFVTKPHANAVQQSPTGSRGNMDIQTNTVRVDVASLTDKQARFLRSVINLIVDGDPAYEEFERGDACAVMTEHGALRILIRTPQQFLNN